LTSTEGGEVEEEEEAKQSKKGSERRILIKTRNTITVGGKATQ